ncbi:MAG: hypothetical protein J7494_06930 [Sphingobium sp.]|nr:hypothetical protein [Sphingobium sp.]
MNINKLVAPVFLASMASGAFAQGAALGGPEGEAQAAAPAPAGNPQITAFVDYQFPNADTDKNGTLTATEFTTWVGGLKAAELQKAGQAADAATVKSYADNALANADADKDGTLSKAELVKFFGG